MARRVVLPMLICTLVTCLLTPDACAWKPTTHMYTANVIADDAKDGKVTIPPYGEFEIAESAKQALTQMDCYRAGSIGPDAFPDLWTGQAYIHPRTHAWAVHLWDRANEYEDAEAWAFTYGFYLHLAGDAWCHDWVNGYAGGAWPSVESFQESTDEALLNVTRHMAIETTFDMEREEAEKLRTSTISIPREFVLKEMVLDPGLRTEMNPMVQALASLYDDKQRDKDDRTLGIRTYNARWFSDLDNGLRRYVQANESAWKGVMERDEDVVQALEENVGRWAENDLLSMLGAPDVMVDAANAPRKVFEALADGVSSLLRMAGIDVDILKRLRDGIVNAMLKSTLGVSKEQFTQMLLAEANTTLFPDTYGAIMSDIGAIPAQASWPHGPEAVETDEAKADAYVGTVNVNGPLYNTVILGKIALLSPEEFERLVTAARTGEEGEGTCDVPANVMLESWLVGIDYSRQCQWRPGEREAEARFLGYSDPYESPVYRRIFKLSPAVSQAAAEAALGE